MVWFTMVHVGELLTLRIFNSRKRTMIGEEKMAEVSGEIILDSAVLPFKY
jgi:hypothetical protein